MHLSTILAALAMLACQSPTAHAQASALWIEPEHYQISEGESLTAELRVGEHFEGISQPYIPRTFTRFEIVGPKDGTPIEGKMGDSPAVSIKTPPNGLAILMHQSAPQTMLWTSWDKFVDFAVSKDIPWALEDHHARGLPESNFTESYTRYAKSLVEVGKFGQGAGGEDRPVGLETEIVALANPYTDDLSGGMPVQVLYQGQPRKEVQIEVLVRAPDGAVTKWRYKTDTEGKVTFPASPGSEYLVEAVLLRPLSGNPDDPGSPVWESLWASETFRIPARSP